MLSSQQIVQTMLAASERRAVNVNINSVILAAFEQKLCQ